MKVSSVLGRGVGRKWPCPCMEAVDVPSDHNHIQLDTVTYIHSNYFYVCMYLELGILSRAKE